MKQYFDFNGTAQRQEYWATMIISWVLTFVGLIIIGGAVNNLLVALLSLALFIAILWVMIAVTVKRIRDAGLNTWWTLAIFVPYIGFVATIVFGCIGSKTE